MLTVITLVLLICIIIDNAFNFDKFFVANFFLCTIICKRKKWTETSKEKKFKNAKIEDVGLNEE